MRVNTQKNKKRCGVDGDSATGKRKKNEPYRNTVTPAQYAKAKAKQNANLRLCGDLTKLMEHMSSVERVKSGRECYYCGETCYKRCTKCNIPCHFHERRGEAKGLNCFYHLHDDKSFGLGWKDKHAMFGGTQHNAKVNWCTPTPRQAKEHGESIAAMERLKNSNYSTRNRETVTITDVCDDGATG